MRRLLNDLRLHNVRTRPLHVYVLVMLGSVLGFLGAGHSYTQSPSIGADALMAGFLLLFVVSVGGLVIRWRRR